jgi:hypothetical protein
MGLNLNGRFLSHKSSKNQSYIVNTKLLLLVFGPHYPTPDMFVTSEGKHNQTVLILAVRIKYSTCNPTVTACR